MANLPYLKGVRTRYTNTLIKEISMGREFLGEDLIGEDTNTLFGNVNRCIGKLKAYGEKLQDQSAKLAEAIGDSDTEFTQQIIAEDTEVCENAMDMCLLLQQLEIKDHEKPAKVKYGKVQTLPMYEELQKLFDHQMRLQEDFFERQIVKKDDRPSSVKLPKLEIASFDGNKLRWIEFWDSFESAVDKNTSISNIDKFNYLRNKLTGDAKSSIDGLALSNENYKLAIDILRERFGNKQEVIDLHYNAMIDLNPAKGTTESLRNMLDEIERHLRSLEVLKQDVDQAIFVSMIRKKLPQEVLLQLEIMNGSDNKWTVYRLRDRLRQYIVAREKSDELKTMDISTNKPKVGASDNTYHSERKAYERFGNGSLTTNTKVNAKSTGNQCRFCHNKHWSDECQRYKTIEDRRRQLKGSCYRCLNEGHYSSDCRSSKTCVYCGQISAHHRSLCPKKFPNKAVNESVNFAEEEEQSDTPDDLPYENVLLSSEETVLMQTALAEIKHQNSARNLDVRLFMDTGSQRSYITKRLADKLELQEDGEHELRLVTFGCERTKVIKTKLTKLEIKLNSGKYMTVSVNIVPNITGTIQRKPVILADREHFIDLTQNMKLADPVPRESESDTVELLIGNDYYLDFLLSEKIEVQPGLYLLASKLGWILTGRTPTNESDHSPNAVNMFVMTHGNQISKTNVFASVDSSLPRKPDLEDFWNLETLGIKGGNVKDREDERAMERFRITIKRENGRYFVTWPWKNEVPDLPENRGLAMGRLKPLASKLQRNPELMRKYNAIIQDQLEKGIIDKVRRTSADGIKHYIPHHVVISPQKTTTKLRVVYDASAKTKVENQSLNECLYRGPVLLHDLCGMILRFRLHPIGIFADIEKAFIQVGLQQSERDVTRFLWFKNIDQPWVNDQNIQEFRFCRIPFGIISSPFLLVAVIESHLDSYQTKIAEKLKTDIYMDNVITGTKTVNDAVDLYRVAKSIFGEAKMNLCEWKTSNTEVNNVIRDTDIVKEECMKVLGHHWNTERDTLSVNEVKILNEDVKLNKKNVLKQVASVFDPLGLFSPVTLRGKETISDCNLHLWRECREDRE